jgi:hypothetical protein
MPKPNPNATPITINVALTPTIINNDNDLQGFQNVRRTL